MSNNLSSYIQGFFEKHLVSERALSSHTVLAYRDTMKLFLKFVSVFRRKSCLDLKLEDLTAETIRKFLAHLEQTRNNSVRTRNARLAAIRSFFRYLASFDPRYLASCQTVFAVPFKRHANPVLDYLEREEVTNIFRHFDRQDSKDRRDEAILRLLYNTGARSQELISLDVSHVRFSRPFTVHIHGKGHKERTCPLWPETIDALKIYLGDRKVRLSDPVALFVNSKGGRLSRFGLRYIIAKRIANAAKTSPTLLTRKVGPHTFRHTTAMHLLQSGVDLNMIRSWLGHSSIETTHGYVEIDLEMKRKTLQTCEGLLPKSGKHGPSWKRSPDILAWLAQL